MLSKRASLKLYRDWIRAHPVAKNATFTLLFRGDDWAKVTGQSYPEIDGRRDGRRIIKVRLTAAEFTQLLDLSAEARLRARLDLALENLGTFVERCGAYLKGT